MQASQALSAAVSQLQAAGIGSPQRHAELLLMFALGRDRTFLYTHPEYNLSAEESERYQDALEQRSLGTPTQYITGHQEFWGLDLIVNPSVLIPRPETEHAVETVFNLAKAHIASGPGIPRLIDVGTGSGCIALALAHELPQAEIHASDISLDALNVARANALRFHMENRLTLHQADLLAGLNLHNLDFVVSNPPYVGEREASKVQREVRDFEPHVAVFGGQEGMEIYRRLIPQAASALRSGGWLVMEIGYTQQAEVSALLQQWSEVSFVADLQGIPRVAIARKP
ncbi:MAG TPA: peptide chain release factor N(5)-glutamine methyltransferase [Terriglobales bacterium]|nr:peptide chain release factor N(5)-glutamine methyltransferase [Terriglobales bacterium]